MDGSLARWAGCVCAADAELDSQALSVAAAETASVWDIS
ncbi:hypothetical protein ASJ78_03620 [Serratia marcescens]|nr:hypothetical protein ASJ78_03620 [Serratia marcescens]